MMNKPGSIKLRVGTLSGLLVFLRAGHRDVSCEATKYVAKPLCHRLLMPNGNLGEHSWSNKWSALLFIGPETFRRYRASRLVHLSDSARYGVLPVAGPA